MNVWQEPEAFHSPGDYAGQIEHAPRPRVRSDSRHVAPNHNGGILWAQKEQLPFPVGSQARRVNTRGGGADFTLQQKRFFNDRTVQDQARAALSELTQQARAAGLVQSLVSLNSGGLASGQSPRFFAPQLTGTGGAFLETPYLPQSVNAAGGSTGRQQRGVSSPANRHGCGSGGPAAEVENAPMATVRDRQQLCAGAAGHQAFVSAKCVSSTIMGLQLHPPGDNRKVGKHRRDAVLSSNSGHFADPGTHPQEEKRFRRGSPAQAGKGADSQSQGRQEGPRAVDQPWTDQNGHVFVECRDNLGNGELAFTDTAAFGDDAPAPRRESFGSTPEKEMRMMRAAAMASYTGREEGVAHLTAGEQADHIGGGGSAEGGAFLTGVHEGALLYDHHQGDLGTESRDQEELTSAVAPTTQGHSHLFPFQDRFQHLQTLLHSCDVADYSSLMPDFISMPASTLSTYAVELENRALQLSLAEGMEMKRVRRLGVMSHSRRQSPPHQEAAPGQQTPVQQTSSFLVDDSPPDFKSSEAPLSSIRARCVGSPPRGHGSPPRPLGMAKLSPAASPHMPQRTSPLDDALALDNSSDDAPSGSQGWSHDQDSPVQHQQKRQNSSP